MVIDLQKQLDDLKSVWIVMYPDCTAMVAAPQDAPDELFPTMPEDLPIEEAIRFGKEIQESLPDWIVLVSALRDSEAGERTLKALPPWAQELNEEQYAQLMELGMDNPFGEWADGKLARIYMLKENIDE